MNADQTANNTPDKVRELQRALYRSVKQNPERRFHALYDKVYRWDILLRAWERVKENGGAAGVDGETLKQIEEYGVLPFLADIHRTIQGGGYRPLPVRRKNIPKPHKPTELRPLGIPAIRDRVVQMATKIVMEPIFEADFRETSFGFRLPGRLAESLTEWLGTHPGVEVIARDRATAYADAARAGAPNAVQVADRFHLVKNVSDVLKEIVERQVSAMFRVFHGCVGTKHCRFPSCVVKFTK